MKWLDRIGDAQPTHRRLDVTAESIRLFSAKSGRTLWQIAWSDVVEIVAFKVDALTMDHICLGFRRKGTSHLDVTDEETPGWSVLIEELGARYGVRSEEWLKEVALPPFAENRRVLWSATAA